MGSRVADIQSIGYAVHWHRCAVEQSHFVAHDAFLRRIVGNNRINFWDFLSPRGFVSDLNYVVLAVNYCSDFRLAQTEGLHVRMCIALLITIFPKVHGSENLDFLDTNQENLDFHGKSAPSFVAMFQLSP